MRMRTSATLAYIGAALILAAAFCVPFVLSGAFTAAVAHAGLHIDPAYTGGTPAHAIQRDRYQIVIYQSVKPRLLQRVEPFVQVLFKPAASLPPLVSEDIDLDADGQPDVHVTFEMPSDTKSNPRGQVVALNGRYQSFIGPGGNSFSRLLVRAGDQIVVRVPINAVTRPR